MKLATLCYVRREDKTLMIHRVKRPNDMHQGKWNGLGGKLEAGETPEACAIREIREESGLEVDELNLRGVLTFPGFSNDEDWYVFVFTAQAKPGETVDPSEGFLEWVPNAKLLDLNLWEGDREFIPWLDHPKFFSGMFRYVDGDLVESTLTTYPPA
jgi:8-oxo-dGTP diphosphatase